MPPKPISGVRAATHSRDVAHAGIFLATAVSAVINEGFRTRADLLSAFPLESIFEDRTVRAKLLEHCEQPRLTKEQIERITVSGAVQFVTLALRMEKLPLQAAIADLVRLANVVSPQDFWNFAMEPAWWQTSRSDEAYKRSERVMVKILETVIGRQIIPLEGLLASLGTHPASAIESTRNDPGKLCQVYELDQLFNAVLVPVANRFGWVVAWEDEHPTSRESALAKRKKAGNS
jgi:hypothetical protein